MSAPGSPNRSSCQRALFNDVSFLPTNETILRGNIGQCHSTPKRGCIGSTDLDALDISAISGDAGGFKTPFPFVHKRISDHARIHVPRNRMSVNFGFVAVGETLRYEYKFVNSSSEQYRFKVSLDSQTDCFKILTNDIVAEPKGEAVIWLEFYAKEPAGLYQNVLWLEKMNGLYRKFSVRVIGCSGCANLTVADEHLRDGTMSYSYSGKIVFQASFYPPPYSSLIHPKCAMTLVNKGDRSAFVCIQPIGLNGKIVDYLKILPCRYVISSHKSKRFELVFQSSNVLPISSNQRHRDCSTKLRVIWGEELERHRFKRSQEGISQNQKFLIYDEDFTRPFENEPKENKNKIEYQQDDFQNSIRVFEINVVDNRLDALIPFS